MIHAKLVAALRRKLEADRERAERGRIPKDDPELLADEALLREAEATDPDDVSSRTALVQFAKAVAKERPAGDQSIGDRARRILRNLGEAVS